MAAKRHTTASWLKTPLGEVVLARESALIAAALENVFGLQAVQVGAWGGDELFLRHCRSRRCALVAPYPGDGVDIVARASALGLASDSVDVMVLPHTLELDEHPHETLREVQRILVGDGHVVLLGFHPLSSWGLCQRARRSPSAGGAISQRRLLDWLTLLGLDPVDRRSYLFTPPINHHAVARRAPRVEQFGERYLSFLGGAYMVVAKKRVYTRLPLRPSWYQRHRVRGGLVEPTTRSAA